MDPQFGWQLVALVAIGAASFFAWRWSVSEAAEIALTKAIETLSARANDQRAQINALQTSKTEIYATLVEQRERMDSMAKRLESADLRTLGVARGR